MERISEYKEEVNHDDDHQKHRWYIMEKQDDQESIVEEEETSTISNGSLSSCSSSDTIHDDDDDDDSSSSTGSSLLDLSDLMSHLPIKRGLSKFYHGKSESFTSLARVMSIEDLPKKTNNPYNNKMKANKKSRGGGLLDSYKAHTLPKPIILKKSSPFLRQRSFSRGLQSTLIPGQHI